MGCELLRRSTHRVELTVAGSALLDRARRLLTDLDEAIATTQSVGGELANRMATMWAPVLEVASRRSRHPGHAHGLRGVPGADRGPRGRRGPTGQCGRRLRRWRSAPASGHRPAVLYLHGGGYIVGSAYGYRPLVGALVAAPASDALVPDYRLAPEHPFPAALEDALSAYRWLAEQRGAGQIVLAGDSAGAGLVCSLLLTLRGAGPAAARGRRAAVPRRSILTSKIMLAADRARPRPSRRPRRTTTAYLDGHSADDPVLSPLSADLSRPAAAARSRPRPAISRSARLGGSPSTRRAAGSTRGIELYPADTHVFQVFWSFLPEAADALQQAGTFIREMLDHEREQSRERT